MRAAVSSLQCTARACRRRGRGEDSGSTILHSMPKVEEGAQQPLLAQGIPVAQPVAQAEAVTASPAPQAPSNVLQAAQQMQNGTGILSMDLNSSMPVMSMPPPGGMSLQHPGMMAPGVHVMAVPATPGIAMLAQVQGLCIRQNIRLAELLVGWEQKNRFKVPLSFESAVPPGDFCTQSRARRSDYGETRDARSEHAAVGRHLAAAPAAVVRHRGI